MQAVVITGKFVKQQAAQLPPGKKQGFSRVQGSGCTLTCENIEPTKTSGTGKPSDTIKLVKIAIQI